MTRENQEHYFALLNSAGDFARERAAWTDIPWCDPAFDSRIFEGRADGVGYLPIMSRV
jgi:hypothetical protein